VKVLKVVYREGDKTSVCVTDPMDDPAAERERERVERAVASGGSQLIRVGNHTLRGQDVIRISIEDAPGREASFYFGDDEPLARRDMRF
jgi:hypothetical protein